MFNPMSSDKMEVSGNTGEREETIMGKKVLVAYFSASGVTANAAEVLAEAAGADLFEIKPAVPYTDKDLDWMDKKSRSSVEMADPASRPEIVKEDVDVSKYDTIFVGFPIWWYVAPTIINTFLESHDFTGKTIVLFATSGGSGFGETVKKLKDCCKGAVVKEGRVLNGHVSKAELERWIETLGI